MSIYEGSFLIIFRKKLEIIQYQNELGKFYLVS